MNIEEKEFEVFASYDFWRFFDNVDNNILESIISWKLFIVFLEDFEKIVILNKTPNQIVSDILFEEVKQEDEEEIHNEEYLKESEKFRLFILNYSDILDNFIASLTIILSDRWIDCSNEEEKIMYDLIISLPKLAYYYNEDDTIDGFVLKNKLDYYHDYNLYNFVTNPENIWIFKLILEWKLFPLFLDSKKPEDSKVVLLYKLPALDDDYEFFHTKEVKNNYLN